MSHVIHICHASRAASAAFTSPKPSAAACSAEERYFASDCRREKGPQAKTARKLRNTAGIQKKQHTAGIAASDVIFDRSATRLRMPPSTLPHILRYYRRNVVALPGGEHGCSSVFLYTGQTSPTCTSVTWKPLATSWATAASWRLFSSLSCTSRRRWYLFASHPRGLSVCLPLSRLWPQ